MAQVAISKCKEPNTMPQDVLEQVESITNAIRLRAFDLFQGRNGGTGSDVDDWLTAERDVVSSPTSELVEDDKGFRARIALPGFEAKEIEVSALPQALVVQAGSTRNQEGTDGNIRFCEFSEKKIFRRIDLPASVDVDKVTASVEQGILQVTAPKVTAKRLSAGA